MVKDRSPPASKAPNAEVCWALHKWVPDVCLALKHRPPYMHGLSLSCAPVGTAVLYVLVALLEGVNTRMKAWGAKPSLHVVKAIMRTGAQHGQGQASSRGAARGPCLQLTEMHARCVLVQQKLLAPLVGRTAFEQASQHGTPAGTHGVASAEAPHDSPLRLFMSSTGDLLIPSDTRMMSLWLVWSTLMRPLKPRPVLRNLQARQISLRRLVAVQVSFNIWQRAIIRQAGMGRHAVA